MPVIHHLFTSCGHNFFGHHGRAPDSFPVEEHERIELIAGKGIMGDRFFGWKEDFKGQITFIDQAVVKGVREKLDQPGLSAGTFRRNVVIEGADLNALIGKRFRIGGAEFSGVEECSPCYWMNTATGDDSVEDFLRDRGGLRCRILTDAALERGSCELEVLD